MSEAALASRLFWVLIGPFAGLYVATFASAWPRWPRPLVGQSRCDRCHKPLRAVDQIPLLSYALKSGQRRCCDGRIPRTFPLGEGGGLAVGLIAALWSRPLDSGLAALLGLCLLYLGLVDLRRFRLPIPALCAAACLAIGLRALTHGPDLLGDLLGAAAVAAAMLLLRRMGPGRGAGLGMGSGDVALAGIVALLTGWRLAPLAIALTALAPLLIIAITRRRGPIAFGFWLCLSGCIALIPKVSF